MTTPISPSQIENVPAEALTLLGLRLPRTDEYSRRRSSHTSIDIIPRDDHDYREEFKFMENDLSEDHSLASSIVRVATYDDSTPGIHLGYDMPAKVPAQSACPVQPSGWLGNMNPGTSVPRTTKALSLDRERNIGSFMIVPPVNALVEFTRRLTIDEEEEPPSSHYSHKMPYNQTFPRATKFTKDEEETDISPIEPRPKSADEPGGPKTVGNLFTSVSDPTKSHNRRFWRRETLRKKDEDVHLNTLRRGFTGYFKTIFKLNNTEPKHRRISRQFWSRRHLRHTASDNHSASAPLPESIGAPQ